MDQKTVDKINGLLGAIEDAKEAQKDMVYKDLFPADYDSLAQFISDCNKEINQLETIN